MTFVSPRPFFLVTEPGITGIGLSLTMTLPSIKDVIYLPSVHHSLKR
jgi:hypothetical protein